MTGGVSFHIFPPTEKSRNALHRKSSSRTASSAMESNLSKPSAGIQEINVAIATEIRTPTVDESQLEWPLSPDIAIAKCTENILPAQTSLLPVICQDEIRAASPAISEATTALSGSPTLVRSNSCATERTIVEAPVMRSIFPEYDHSLPLSRQRYRPALPSPTYIPQEKINKHVSYTKDVYSSMYNGAESSSPPDRWYSSEAHLSQLWDIANGKSCPTIPQTYTLQLHRQEAKLKPKKGSKASESLKIGQSSLEPFYSLTHSAVIPEEGDLLQKIDHANEHEIIIHRHHPTKPRSVPIAVLNLAPPPIFPRSEGHGSKESTVITTIYPKLAALLALDAAAHSPAASEIALLDPKANSPAAAHLAQEAVRETALRESCSLFWEADPAAATLGHYHLHHPTLGLFPVALSGEVSASFSAATGSSRPSTAEGHSHRAARVEIRAPSTQTFSFSSPSSSQFPATPSSTTKPSLFPTLPPLPSPLLASLDFTADTLTLNVAEILRFENAHLLNVLVTTLLAVCVSETQRAKALAAAMAFAGPPSSVYADKLAKKEGKKNGRREKSTASTTTTSSSSSPPATTRSVSGPGLNHIITSFARKDNSSNVDFKDLADLKYIGTIKGKSKLGDGMASGAGRDGAFQPAEQIERLPRVTKHILTGLGVGMTVAMYTVGVAAKLAAGTVVVVSDCVSDRVSGGGGGIGVGVGNAIGHESGRGSGNRNALLKRAIGSVRR